jgi:nucleobase:cation symporter-1, NCS1 family
VKDTGIAPATKQERKLTQLDLTLIWFGAAIAISEIWAGGLPQLTGLGLGAGLLAIGLGRLVGNGLMAAMAQIGAATGLPSLVLTRPAFGVRGSYLPALFNIFQLIGWTGWMVFVAAEYVATLAKALGMEWTRGAWLATAITIGTLCTVWALLFAGQWWWKWVERTSAALLLLLTVGMTYLVLQRTGLPQLSLTPGNHLGILVGMDIVIAMSVSWLPLVADYSRYSRISGGDGSSPKRRPAAAATGLGGSGTFWGYFIGGTWMYAVGLLVALSTGTETPDAMVVEIMAGRGLAWVVLAIGLVIISTTTTTFLDIYSAAVSAQNLWPQLSSRVGSVLCGVLGTACALLLNVHAYAPFLSAIGAIFLPAFTVVLVDHYLLSDRSVDTSELARRQGRYWYNGGYNWRALLAWLIGFLVYDWAQGFPSLLAFYKAITNLATLLGGALPVVNPAVKSFAYGASIPCIVATSVAYLLLVAVFGSGRQVGPSERKRASPVAAI